MFIKKDEEFECINCHKKVQKLRYTSRDHCNYCLYSLHVDVTPGDRLNDCKGVLVPINVENGPKKQQIVYKCTKCNKLVRNIVAEDDSKDEIYKIVSNYARSGGGK